MRLSLFAPLDDLMSPPPPADRVAFLKAQPFAHRGLHGPSAGSGGVVENSQAAFRAAVALGHGIELDVQAARDGEAIVFHDKNLERLTDATGDVATRSLAELSRIKLSGTNETLVQLSDVLQIIRGKVPVLVEVKTNGPRIAPLCLSVRRALEGYRGDVGVMSFNPMVGAWFRDNAPRVVRGLVVTEENRRNLKGAAERWASMAKAKPDFLAYDVRDLPSKFAAAARARGIPVLTWTVRNAEAERRAFAFADEAIYEKTT